MTTATNWTPTSIVTPVPSGAATGNVVVTVSGLQSNGVLFTVLPQPMITSLSVPSGPATTPITITGLNFGSAQGTVTFAGVSASIGSWSTTSIVTSVPTGAITGPVIVTSSAGLISNSVGFTVPLVITGLSPSSGAIGTLITVTGSSFGATQNTSSVAIGGTPLAVLSWSDTQILGGVAAGTSTGAVSVQEGSNTVYGPTFTVNTSFPYSVQPQYLNMLVGQTRTLTVSGILSTQVVWRNSNPSVVSLSTDNPPVITAIAPGNAIVYAGVVPVPITVYAGSSLPSGTRIWTLPLPAATGGIQLIPAVPSSSGTDVFAIENPGQTNSALVAISADGSVAWGVSLKPGASVIPDFSGNAFQTYQTIYQGSVGGQTVSYLPHVITALQPSGSGSSLYTFSTQPAPGGLCADEINYCEYTDGFAVQTIIPDTTGMLFIQDNATVIVMNPSTGQTIATATMENSTFTGENVPECWGGYASGINGSYTRNPIVGRMIVAGDGNAYVAYAYGIETLVGDPSACSAAYTDDSHLMVLRVSPDGSYAKIQLKQASYDGVNGSYYYRAGYLWAPPVVYPSYSPLPVITNAGTGATVFSYPSQCQCSNPPETNILMSSIAQDTIITQQALAFGVDGPYGASLPPIPGFLPTLQREDGSYVGTAGNDVPAIFGLSGGATLMAVGPDGSTLWQHSAAIDNYLTPLYAISDGGVIATTTQSGTLGTLYTFDQNGNITTQTPDTGAVFSWTNNWYVDPLGSISEVSLASVFLAHSWWAVQNGSQSQTAAAAENPGFAPLPSCPGATTPCAQEALDNALGSLRAILSGTCSLCQTQVFGSNKLNRSKNDFKKFLALPVRFYDGTRSTVFMNKVMCDQGFFATCPSDYYMVSVYQYLNGAEAITRTPSENGKGELTFFDPAQVCKSFGLSVGAVQNQAVIFHEALHGFTGLNDSNPVRGVVTLESALGISYNPVSAVITDYLRINVLGGGSTDTCGN